MQDLNKEFNKENLRRAFLSAETPELRLDLFEAFLAFSEECEESARMAADGMEVSADCVEALGETLRSLSRENIALKCLLIGMLGAITGYIAT